jgi:hypothetical protein
MTGPDQPVQPSQDAHDATEGAGVPTAPARQPAAQFPLFPRKSGWLRITLVLIAFGGLSAVVIGVLIGIGTHQANVSTPSAGATPASTTTSGGHASPAARGGIPAERSTTGTTKPNIVSAAKVAESGGALSLPQSMAKPVISWQFGPGGTHLAAVSRLFGDALQAAGIRQYPEMKSACTQLTGSVATAMAGPAIPDAAMQALYAKALAELARGATDCRAAIRLSVDESVVAHVDTTLLHQSMSELGAGAEDIFRATAEIEIASRQHH